MGRELARAQLREKQHDLEVWIGSPSARLVHRLERLHLISDDTDLQHRRRDFFARNAGFKRHNALDDAFALRTAMISCRRDL
ncbi:MAG: hypothetical protein AB1651_09470 [Pseudomonadota bacterium]